MTKYYVSLSKWEISGAGPPKPPFAYAHDQPNSSIDTAIV